MESLFDPSEFGGDEEPEAEQQAPAATQVASANSIIDDLAAPVQQPDEDVGEISDTPDDYMERVDLRLEIAHYYRALLSTPLFDKDTPAARVVVREHHRFIKERLEALLTSPLDGSKEPARGEAKVEPLFAPEEVAGLKIIIGQMRAKGMIEASAAPSVPVAAAPAPAPPAPKLTPAPVVAVRTAPVRTPAVATPVVPPPAPAPRVPAPAPQAAATQKAKPGRPPRAAKPLVETKTVTNPDTGVEVEITKQRIQRPSGALPFPTDMSAATNRSALTQISTQLPATVSGRPLAAVIAAAVKPAT